MRKIRARAKKWIITGCLMLALCGCGDISSKTAKKEKTYEEPIVVEVFDSLANYQGIQSGWFAKIVKDKFNMELNVIAPNIAGGGATLFEIRSAAGNVGELIICNGENGVLQDLVTAGLVIDMSPYLTDKQILRYEDAINFLNRDITPRGIYAIPSEVSENSPMAPSDSLEPTFAPYLRWDIYSQIGYPQMDTLEDMLMVLKQMQEACPVSETGEKTYGFSFFKDWDGNMMNAAKQPCCFYGYDEFGFVLAAADGSDYQSIIDSDSLYMRVLKLYFDANQMGLVDPESPNHTFDSVFKKYQNGEVMYSPWPWLGQSAYNTTARKEAGKGFMIADIADMKIFSYGCFPEGRFKAVIAVGSQAKDPERMVDFIDWIYSPEGIMINGAQGSGETAGPEGLCWELGEEGPYLTEFGIKAFFDYAAEMPEEWGTGTWEDGISQLNYKAVARNESNPDGIPYSYVLWDSVQALQETRLERDWKAFMEAENSMDFLEKNDKLAIAPGCQYYTPAETSEISTIRNQCTTTIIDYSWDMVFAESEEEFYQYQKGMQDTVISLGYQKVLEVDLQNAKDQNQARVLAVEKYNEKEQK